MNEHVQAIKAAARELEKGNIWFTGDHIAAIDEHADALAAQVDRLQSLVTAEAALTAALVDLLTDEQVSRPDYPTDLDREATRLAHICHEHGDLPDEEG